MRYLLSLSVALGLIGSVPAARAGETDDRVVTYLISADELIADAKHIVVDLAGEQKAWENSVLPNLEIWLFGVNREKPVGLDVLFDADKGRVLEFHVPIANRKEFLNNNLGDVGVVSKQDRKNRDLYELSEVIEGWLLFTKAADGQEYGSIVTNKANLPTKSPVTKWDLFKKAGYEAGLRWSALEATKAQRDKGFDKMLSELTSNLKKRPEETQAQFDLRKLTVEQNANRLSRMLSNSAELMAGWNTDAKARKYSGSSTMTGLPGTDVEKNIKAIGTVHSKFATVATPDNSAMSARVMLPLAEVYQTEQAKTYETSLTALKERIDKKEDVSADEKTARKQLSEKVVKLATDSLKLGWLDVYAELVPSQGSLYTGISAVRVQDSAVATEIVNLLPKAQAGWTVKTDVAEEAGAKIHLVDMKAKLPETFKTYFGTAGEAYVATGDQTVWVATGPEAMTRLKAALAAAGGKGEAVNTPLKLVMHVHPALQIGKSLTEDRDIELFRTLKEGSLMKGPSQETSDKKGAKKDEERRVSRNALQNFKWHDTALKALEGGKDMVTLEITKKGDALTSEMNAEEGVMKAVGKVIAKFAVEMLQ
ncbi:MAG TPA: hypothetical protein VM510_00505 [Caulifigura sp.]|nr:hypothetical protein [Caulifigura sp.]